MATIYGNSAVCWICGKLQSECMGLHDNNVYGIRCTKCLNTPCSCDEEEPFNSKIWFRDRIVTQMTRDELEQRVSEYHEMIYKLRDEITKLKEATK